jgi:hypothetical protein
MSKEKPNVWTIHWAVKLVLTVLAGGMIAIGIWSLPLFSLAFLDIVIPEPLPWPLCIATIVFSTTLCACLLYLREGNGWRRSLLMGVVVGLGGAAIVTVIGFLFVIWLLSCIQLV